MPWQCPSKYFLLVMPLRGLVQNTHGKAERGIKGHTLVRQVLRECKGIVNRVAKSEVGAVIVCGKSTRWWIRRRLHWGGSCIYEKVIIVQSDLSTVVCVGK